MRLAAKLLRTARLRAGITQAELARRAGVPRSVVSAYERGHRDPSVDALARLLAAAGCELRIGAASAVDPHRAGRLLAQVLDLAESLPTRDPGPLRNPRLAPAASE